MLAIAPKPPTKSPIPPNLPWFTIGLVGILLASLALRFWGLSRFNTLVFDEVYYAKFASHFLKRELIFTGHPPLSTYIIAIGIWIGEKLPWGQDGPINGLAGLPLSPFSYRWLNALVGSFLPLLVGAIAYQLSNRRIYGFLAALFVAADGLFLVESRYALNNVYLITFGLLGNLGFLIALKTQHWRRWLWLGFAGIGFGAAAAIKWNGLGFLLGAYLVWGTGWIFHIVSLIRRAFRPTPLTSPTPPSPRWQSPLHRLTTLHVGHILIGFVLIPALTYYLSWIPYMQLDPQHSFWQLQALTLDYHHRVGGLTAHPYCSLWYTWPLMLRPIAYFYEVSHGSQEPIPIFGPSVPQTAGTTIYDVHAMGNPVLWWLSTAAVVMLVGWLSQQARRWLTTLRQPNLPPNLQQAHSEMAISPHTQLGTRHWIAIYLLLNWAANLLPWLQVTRCVFLYHYMESLLFALLAIALLVYHWLRSPHKWQRLTGIAMIVVILMAFGFWMPLYLGLPLSPEELQLRRWLPSWV